MKIATGEIDDAVTEDGALKISTDLPSVGDVLALGPISTVPVCLGALFVWLGSEGNIGPSNQRLMLGAALICLGFAAWRCRYVQRWHIYRHVYDYGWWAVATVAIWGTAALFFGFAVVAGRFPLLP